MSILSETAHTLVPTGFAASVALALPTVVQRIVDELRPQQIILFGSYAYGVPTVDSDVDLLVIMETSASATDRYLSVSRLLSPRPFPVDILVKTPQEVADALAVGDYFVREMLTRGQVLYECAN